MRAVRGYVCLGLLGASVYACSPRVSVGDLGETLDGAAGGSTTGGAAGSSGPMSDANPNTQGCVLNSDCQAPLICAQSRCHVQCATSRDCLTPQSCVATNAGNACVLMESSVCVQNSDCPAPLACAPDHQCRNQCNSGRDCLVGQSCAASFCVDGDAAVALGDVAVPTPDASATPDVVDAGRTLPDGRICPDNFVLYLPPKSVDCTGIVVPLGYDPCTIPENAICVWQDQLNPGYTACGCYAVPGGKAWSCTGGGAQGTFGSSTCPRTQPDPGSACTGHAGETCYFPEQFCSCGLGGGNWSCTPNQKPASPPREVAPLCAPSNVDESKQIKDLSDAEAAAWCSWYADPRNNPRPAVNNIDPPGVTNYGYHGFSVAGMDLCLPNLPVPICVKNLRTQPCTATVGQLDECLETIQSFGSFPGWVGHGCAPLIANPTCARIIVQPTGGDAGPPCNAPWQ